MGNSKVFCVKISNNGKTLESKKQNNPVILFACSVVILAIVKSSFYRTRDKIHLHRNNFPRTNVKLQSRLSMQASHPKYAHRIWAERDWREHCSEITQVWI